MKREEMKEALRDNLVTLRQLRDEIRLHLHLANMEARDTWIKLEPRFYEAQKLAEKRTEKSRKAIEEIVQSFRLMRDVLAAPTEKHTDFPH